MASALGGHQPVLAARIVELLAPAPGESFLDCTAGLGGHARLIADRLGRGGRVILMDVDPGNLERATANLQSLAEPPRIEAIRANFNAVGAILPVRQLCVDMVLADLGFASNQMDDPARGFSFSTDGPLDMRLDPDLVGTAADLVNALPEKRLADLIYRFGEDPFARQIARRVVEARKSAPITTTGALAELVRKAYGSRARESRMHPATRTFMALRIAVNDELGALERLLAAVAQGARAAFDGRGGWLRNAARVAIISFHSLEDRLVKRAFADLAREGLAHEVIEGPIEASEEEISGNPRARSAKLRILRLSGRS